MRERGVRVVGGVRMTALVSRDIGDLIGDLPGLSGPDTRRDDWVQRCEDHANENAGALSARCLADPNWLRLITGESELIAAQDNLALALSDPCEYANQVVTALRALALGRAYAFLLAEAMNENLFRKPELIAVTWTKWRRSGERVHQEEFCV